MTFNSLWYFLFFPVVTGLYFFTPHRFRWAILLAASALFYMAFVPAYIVILGATIVIDYTAALFMERTQGRVRTALLIVSVVATCLILFFFKYYLFFTSSLTTASNWTGHPLSFPILQILLPIGLSFHTFQSLSYIIEVYRGNQPAERHFGIYALYVLFFPQLVAGPIERPQHVLPQFKEVHHPDPVRFTRGMKRIVWGLFKKVVIADRLAWAVNSVYGAPTEYQGIPLIVATVCFAFQIYYDFSGYSDMALGSADVLGFTLMENFRQPYLSSSFSEFWKRWHISLSSWLRDYIYIPLGGSRGVSKLTSYRNLIITFFLSGLWHGAGWTYIVWGLINGGYVVGEDILSRYIQLTSLSERGRLWVRRGIVFFFIGCGWIFFRAHTLSQAWHILTHAPLLIGSSWNFGRGFLGLGMSHAIIALLAIVCVEVGETRYLSSSFLQTRSRWIKWACYALFVLATLNLGVSNTQSFIYFQF